MTTNELRNQISNNFNLKETDELLDIWQTNNRVEWSDEAFEVIREILKKRGIELPEQDEPVYEHNKKSMEGDDEDFSEVELKIIDDENPPDFYAPFEALKVEKWLDLAAKAMVILTILGTLLSFHTTKNVASAYFPSSPNSIFVYFVTIIIMAFNIVIAIPIYYLPLRALSQVLGILTEMEYNSRKAK